MAALVDLTLAERLTVWVMTVDGGNVDAAPRCMLGRILEGLEEE